MGNLPRIKDDQEKGVSNGDIDTATGICRRGDKGLQIKHRMAHLLYQRTGCRCACKKCRDAEPNIPEIRVVYCKSGNCDRNGNLMANN